MKYVVTLVGIRWGAPIPLEKTAEGVRASRAELPDTMQVTDINARDGQDAELRALISCAATAGYKIEDVTAFVVMTEKQHRKFARMPADVQYRHIMGMLAEARNARAARSKKLNPRRRRNPKVSHIGRFEIFVEFQKARFAARQTPALDMVYRYVKDVIRESLGRDVRLNVDRFPGHDPRKRSYLLWCMLPAAHAKLIRFPRHELVGLRLMLRSRRMPRLLAFAV